MDKRITTMANTLVQASYNMSLVEKRLLVLFIANINNNRENPEVLDPRQLYLVSVREYAELYNLDYEVAKNELENAVDKLYKQSIIFTDLDGKVIETRWISAKAEYDKEDHSVGIYWAIKIIPYISELTKNFSSYKLRWLRELRSVYSIRIYELVSMELAKSHKKEKYVNVYIDDLRTMLQLPESYKIFSNIRNRVLDKAVEEITAKTELDLTYTEDLYPMYIKKGNRVVGVRLKVSKKRKQDIRNMGLLDLDSLEKGDNE